MIHHVVNVAYSICCCLPVCGGGLDWYFRVASGTLYDFDVGSFVVIIQMFSDHRLLLADIRERVAASIRVCIEGDAIGWFGLSVAVAAVYWWHICC